MQISRTQYDNKNEYASGVEKIYIDDVLSKEIGYTKNKVKEVVNIYNDKGKITESHFFYKDGSLKQKVITTFLENSVKKEYINSNNDILLLLEHSNGLLTQYKANANAGKSAVDFYISQYN